ncbi:MAG: CpsD/CapB family tyrosine-protein kinase [Ruminococcaceae bacterium]|nr:CpsD/CapB family tyrosine-protein kinase [Oscillospiraceae bacterium]
MAKKLKRQYVTENFEALNEKTPFKYLEALKSLRTNVEFISASEGCKTIMMVSSLSGEGKTTLSINLAVALAQSGKKVLLCDCDLRRPKVQRYLRIKQSVQQGVSTVLNGSTDIQNAIGYIDELGIYVMLAGPTPPNPSELLASDKAKFMFEELKSRFDFIICDTPPVFIVADAVAFSKYIDGAVLIVRQNYASKNQILETINRLKVVDTKILGTVLNDYDSKADTYYKYDKYYKYSAYYTYERQDD